MSLSPGDLLEVTVDGVAHGGWCVAKPAGFPVMFVRHALPGERVMARVTEVTRALARADAVEVIDASPDRVVPPCPNARPGGCGGCDWQHASLPAQRALKAAVVREQLQRLAKIDREVTVEELPTSIPNEPSSLAWRTRVQFAVDVQGLAGLRAHRSHEVIDIGDCPIAHPAIRALEIPRRDWPGAIAVEAAVSPGGRPPGPPDTGALSARSASLAALGRSSRAPLSPGDREGALSPGGRPPGPSDTGALSARSASLAALGRSSRAPLSPGDREGALSRPPRGGSSAETEVIVVSERRPAEIPDVGAESVLSRYGRKLAPVRGRPYLTRYAAGREWRVSAGGFWQVHPAAADTLTAAMLAVLEPKPGDSVLDLYCGAGLFAGSLAAAVGPDGTVTGVESDEAAVRDARHNLRDFPWASIRRGDVGPLLGGAGQRGTLPRRNERRGAQGRDALPPARLVVADPPRSGLDRRVVDYLAGRECGAERFCYVSCDPATLARDIGLLLARGWQLDGLRAFDAFPMTHHVECVAALTRAAST